MKRDRVVQQNITPTPTALGPVAWNPKCRVSSFARQTIVAWLFFYMNNIHSTLTQTIQSILSQTHLRNPINSNLGRLGLTYGSVAVDQTSSGCSTEVVVDQLMTSVFPVDIFANFPKVCCFFFRWEFGERLWQIFSDLKQPLFFWLTFVWGLLYKIGIVFFFWGGGNPCWWVHGPFLVRRLQNFSSL